MWILFSHAVALCSDRWSAPGKSTKIQWLHARRVWAPLKERKNNAQFQSLTRMYIDAFKSLLKELQYLRDLPEETFSKFSKWINVPVFPLSFFLWALWDLWYCRLQPDFSLFSKKKNYIAECNQIFHFSITQMSTVGLLVYWIVKSGNITFGQIQCL